MPIRIDVFAPDRLVVGVASDRITLSDLVAFLAQIQERQLYRFRKIIDISNARTDITQEQLAMFSVGLREALKDTKRGPLAIVSGKELGDFARLFSAVTGEGRPAQVFRSIHEARRWLNTNDFPC